LGSGGVGRARDLGCKLSQRIAGHPAILMTTDANSRVAPDWITAHLDAMEAAHLALTRHPPRHSQAARDLPVLLTHLEMMTPKWAAPASPVAQVSYVP
jgi:hypothetical protein